jgi:hypothetical protein
MAKQETLKNLDAELKQIFRKSYTDYVPVNLKLLEVEIRQKYFINPFYFWDIISQFKDLGYIINFIEKDVEPELLNLKFYQPRQLNFIITKIVMGTNKIISPVTNKEIDDKLYNTEPEKTEQIQENGNK